MKEKLKQNLHLIIAIIIAIVLIVFDQVTKQIVVNKMDEGQTIVFIKGFINWVFVYNTGFAFGLGSEGQIYLAFVSLVGTFVLLYFTRKINFKKNLVYSIAIILMLAGTVGNMIDRFFSANGVIDFISPAFIDFAVFNVADSYLTIGTIFLIIYLIFIYKEPIKKEDVSEEIKNSEEESSELSDETEVGANDD